MLRGNMNSFSFCGQGAGVKGRRLSVLFGMTVIFFACLFFGFFFRFDKAEYRNEAGGTDAYVCDVNFSSLKAKANLSFGTDASARLPQAKGTAAALASAEVAEGTAGAFVMQNGASIRLNAVTGMRFKARISDSLVEEVAASEDKAFGFVIAPRFYFEKVLEISGDEGTPDYVNALARLVTEYGATPALQLICEPVLENGQWIIQASVAKILYNNTNLAYSAVAYVKTESEGEGPTYLYAEYSEADCLTSARSVAYVATAALQDESGQYTEEQTAVLHAFISRSVGSAYGLTESESSEQEGSVALSLSGVPGGVLRIGESFALSAQTVVSYSGGDSSLTLPLYWKSSDPAVVSVSTEGRVTALAEGTASVFACFGEACVSVDIVCSQEMLFTCELADHSGYENLLEILPRIAKVPEGGTFEAELRVADYESYGEMSFWIDGVLYTTENGVCAFSRTVSADCVFELAFLSSSLNYFAPNGSQLFITSDTNVRKNLPPKIILPSYAKDGTVFRSIQPNTFNNGTNATTKVCVNLREITIPESYTSVPADVFRNCSSLEIIYLKNTALAEASVSGEVYWTGCTSLKSIYVPEGTLEAYANNRLWKDKKALLKEFAF